LIKQVWIKTHQLSPNTNPNRYSKLAKRSICPFLIFVKKDETLAFIFSLKISVLCKNLSKTDKYNWILLC